MHGNGGKPSHVGDRCNGVRLRVQGRMSGIERESLRPPLAAHVYDQFTIPILYTATLNNVGGFIWTGDLFLPIVSDSNPGTLRSGGPFVNLVVRCCPRTTS